MAGAPPPLRLKDLLELDCDSCSAAGFRCYPRRLGESAPAPPTRRLLDSPPPSLRQLHPTSKLSSSLSRTISRRLGFFWRRRDEDGGEDDAAASGSESGASSETTTTTSDNSSRRRGSRCESDSDFSTATVSSASDSMDAVTVAATADEHEVITTTALSSLVRPVMVQWLSVNSVGPSPSTAFGLVALFALCIMHGPGSKCVD